MAIEKAIFAAGCFWGIEHKFRKIPGVLDAISGYTGGHKQNPTYSEVCHTETGHAEAVEVTFDDAAVSYGDLLEAFWQMHDPTQYNRQGPDIGSQYRSAVFYLNGQQKQEADISREVAQKRFASPIVTEITPAETFWKAEEYHQRYIEKKGGGYCAA